MDKISDCKKELRRLIKKSAFAKDTEKRYNLMIATFGKLAEFERLLMHKSEVTELKDLLKDTS